MKTTKQINAYVLMCLRKAIFIILLLMTGPAIFAQTGCVDYNTKISSDSGLFAGPLSNTDYFGGAVEQIGDLNNDGTVDIAVGADHDDDGGTDAGAIWILFMDSNATVKAEQKITESVGGFSGTFSSNDRFGHSIAVSCFKIDSRRRCRC